jgi:HSP20 family protein
MALSIFGLGNRRGDDPLDAFFSDSFLFPSSSTAWTLSSFPDHPGFARDVAAVANTQVDWKETADSHIFKANLPGKRSKRRRC